jgi:hypothetical protein
MADRRMISVKIAGSAKFVKLPLSTQALYFHLVINADDDGIVEAFNVMRIVGASEGDFQLLIDKEYIVLLNDDFVTYIPHWLDHNLMRDDRKVNSIYQSLLLEKVKDVRIMIPRPRKDRKQKFLQLGTSQGRPLDGHGTAEDSIGKVSIGKNNLSENNRRKSILFPFFPYGKYPDIDPVLIQDLKSKFDLLWGCWLNTRRGTQQDAKDSFERVANETGLNEFADRLEIAFGMYMRSDEWNAEIVKSLPKWIPEFTNWEEEYYHQLKSKNTKPLEMGKTWERMRQHVESERK